MTNSSFPDVVVPSGLAAFDALRAEDEPWLAACHVPPAEFSLMAGPRSALIFGESGSGKTALRLALERAWNPQNHKPRWLLVDWPINALVGLQQNVGGSFLVVRQQAQVFDAVARTLLRWLGQNPDLWQGASAGARIVLTWFIQRSLAGDLAAYAASLAEDETIADPIALHEIVAAERRELLSPDASPDSIASHLMETLSRMGVQGTRILVDDVEPWWELQPERLADSLHAFLSTLELFTHPTFVYKMFLPEGLASRLGRASGVVRRRVDVFHLNWSESELVVLVERRLAVALGRPGFALADLGPADRLRAWLAGCGGASPRGWLETARSFLAAYLAAGASQPLTDKECRAVQQRHPPRLWVDPATGAATVGWRWIEGLGQGHLALLCYLLDHAGQLCSRKQLYKAYVEAYPDGHADGDALPAEYASVLDSALWRLRALIEADPDAPVLLKTKKGQGVLLRAM